MVENRAGQFGRIGTDPVDEGGIAPLLIRQADCEQTGAGRYTARVAKLTSRVEHGNA